MSLTPSDVARHKETMRSYIEETERLLRECREAIDRAATLTHGDVVDNTRRCLEAAESLRYWLSRRLRA